jgi:hypothetical protein
MTSENLKIGDKVTGLGKSGRRYTGTYLGSSPVTGLTRIALQGAGKVFVDSVTVRKVAS